MTPEGNGNTAESKTVRTPLASRADVCRGRGLWEGVVAEPRHEVWKSLEEVSFRQG